MVQRFVIEVEEMSADYVDERLVGWTTESHKLLLFDTETDAEDVEVGFAESQDCDKKVSIKRIGWVDVPTINGSEPDQIEAATLLKIKIDIQKFVESIQKDESGYIFSEEDAFRYIVDSLNDAGIDAELRYQDTDFSIIVDGERVYISYFADDPASALIQSLRSLSDEINSSKTRHSWYSYQKGEHFISFEEKKPEED
jgi:hypothetical protein